MFGVMGKHVFRRKAVTFYPRGGVKSNSEGGKNDMQVLHGEK